MKTVKARMPERRGRRGVLLVCGVAVAAGAVGALSGQLIRSPDEAARAAAPPRPSMITASVEQRALTNTVVIRGDIRAARTVQLALKGALGTPESASDGQVVTGRVPRRGAWLKEGDVALEVSGRPMLLVEGSMPMYRALRPGDEGKDVRQLERALQRMGFAPGTVDEDYTEATGAAVARWYTARGYRPMGPARETKRALDAARRQVTAAENAVMAANRARAAAKSAPNRARNAGLSKAEQNLHRARTSLAEASGRRGAWVPRGEVTVVPQLPLRVGTVKARVGQAPEGDLLTLTGGEQQIDCEIAPAYHKLVDKGAKVQIDDPQLGIKATGEVSHVAARLGTDGAPPDMHRLRVRPTGTADLNAGVNVRVRIPVGSTAGKVLAVPESALFTRADGVVRVRLLRAGAVVEVTVVPGLVAEGMIELRQANGLKTGDEVVVGSRG